VIFWLNECHCRDVAAPLRKRGYPAFSLEVLTAYLDTFSGRRGCLRSWPGQRRKRALMAPAADPASPLKRAQISLLMVRQR